MIALAALDIAGTTVEEGGAVYRALHDAVRRHDSRAEVADVAHWMGADKRTAIRALLAIGTDLAALDGAGPDEGTADKGGAEGTATRVAVTDVAATEGTAGRTSAVNEGTVEETFLDFEQLLRKAYEETPPVAMPGVLDAFAALRAQGAKIALTTGFSADVTDLLLDRLGWRDGVVDTVICTDDVPAGRPAPYMVHRAMERTGVWRASEVLTAGDTVLDLEAGTNAGAGVVVGVLSGDVPRETLAAAPHTHLLDSVADLPDLLARMR